MKWVVRLYCTANQTTVFNLAVVILAQLDCLHCLYVCGDLIIYKYVFQSEMWEPAVLGSTVTLLVVPKNCPLRFKVNQFVLIKCFTSDKFTVW